MIVLLLENYREMSRYAADILARTLTTKPDALVCAATGHSPTGLYAHFVDLAQAKPELARQVRILKLDEWAGLGPEDEGSCDHYLTRHLLGPLGIGQDRVIAFDGKTQDPAEECKRVHAQVQAESPLDLAILGLGTNGHIGMNEPGDSLEAFCHVSTLTEESRQHGMIRHMAKPPTHGLTLGMGNLLSAEQLILMITGPGKNDICRHLLAKKTVSTQLPASFFWLHPNAICLIDSESVII